MTRPESVSIAIRKLDPAIAKYLISFYGHGWPDDVELWEKVPTEGDNRHWIDVLSGKAAKEDEAGDPLIEQFYLSLLDTTEVVRQLGKCIDDLKQGKADSKAWREVSSAYIDGHIDGLRTAIKAIRGDHDLAVGDPTDASAVTEEDLSWLT